MTQLNSRVRSVKTTTKQVDRIHHVTYPAPSHNESDLKMSVTFILKISSTDCDKILLKYNL